MSKHEATQDVWIPHLSRHVTVDRDLAPVIHALNSHGIATESSAILESGMGVIELTDGREVFVCDKPPESSKPIQAIIDIVMAELAKAKRLGCGTTYNFDTCLTMADIINGLWLPEMPKQKEKGEPAKADWAPGQVCSNSLW